TVIELAFNGTSGMVTWGVAGTSIGPYSNWPLASLNSICMLSTPLGRAAGDWALGVAAGMAAASCWPDCAEELPGLVLCKMVTSPVLGEVSEPEPPQPAATKAAASDAAQSLLWGNKEGIMQPPFSRYSSRMCFFKVLRPRCTAVSWNSSL